MDELLPRLQELTVLYGLKILAALAILIIGRWVAGLLRKGLDRALEKKEPEPTIAVTELADNSVNFAVRPWVKKEHYWPVMTETLENLKIRFDEEGISIPFPQRDVHLRQS